MPDARTLIVTGASSGIGRALAIAAARDGFSVVLVARRAERLADVSRAIHDAGGACATVVTDVRAPGAPAKIVDAAIGAFERIDVVVNNAGAGAYGALLEQRDADIEAQWQQHVAAPLRIARAALPHLERTRGQLVFVGSGIARIPLPLYGAYALAKAAIRAGAIQLRRELRGRGIAVTYVDPGLVATEFHEAAGIERDHRIPPATPERVARAILRGIAARAATVNGVWWQTAATAAGEMAGTLADRTVAGFTPKRKPAVAAPGVETPAPPVNASATLETALEPLARRMERVKLPQTFIRGALVPGATLELNDLAMRWAGMPNKNERAAMHEVLEALAAHGYLEPMGEETWKVVRSAD